jgi:hypothetical protein
MGPTTPSLACDPSLWNHVYHPSRLQVRSECTVVAGSVQAVLNESDGDVHIRLGLDQANDTLLNDANRAEQDGDLVVEIVCVGPIPPDLEGTCGGYRNAITIPTVHDRVRVVGPYVLDTVHGWMEIHPVSNLTIDR